MNWEEQFRPLLDLPAIQRVAGFQYLLEFHPHASAIPDLSGIGRRMFDQAISVLRAAGRSTSSLRYLPQEHESASGDPEGGLRSLFIIADEDTQAGFGITVADRAVQIAKYKSAFPDLVRFWPLGEGLCKTILSDEVLGAWKILPRIYRITFQLDFEFALGTLVASKERAGNDLVVHRMVALDGISPLACLGLKRLLRSQLKLSTVCDVDGRDYNAWVTVDAPMNNDNAWVDVSVQLRRTEELGGIGDGDALDWRRPIMGFLKPRVLEQFLPQLFKGIDVSTR